MPSNKLRNKNGYFKLNNVDYSADIVDLELVVEEDTPTTLTGPTGRYYLRGTGIASVKAASLQQFLRSSAGAAAVPFVFGRDGATASTNNVHRTGTVTLKLEPNAKMGPYGETGDFAIDLECDDTPAVVTS